MAGYRRKTASSPSEVLEQADTFLPGMLGLQCSEKTDHAATWVGTEGTVTISAHRHGPYTDVVADTDQLRTSRLDYELQRLLTQLPYEPGDAGGPGSGEPS